MSKLLNSIKHHEGFRSKVYKCSLGFDTIGYGSAIKDLVLDEDIASLILERKVDKLIKELDKKFDWYGDLPEEARDDVTEMCYQLGVTAFSKFKKTISYLKDGEWADCAYEMLDSLWARQTPQRAKELSNRIKEL